MTQAPTHKTFGHLRPATIPAYHYKVLLKRWRQLHTTDYPHPRKAIAELWREARTRAPSPESRFATALTLMEKYL